MTEQSGSFRLAASSMSRPVRAGEWCQAVHDAIQEAVTEFTEGAPQSDDITLVVLEFG
jgi:serine phosphatase RsbU (regulator of sigma subunit)